MKKAIPLIIGIALLGGTFLLISRPSPEKIQEEVAYIAPYVAVFPSQIVQGDPIMISVLGTSTPTSITLAGESLDIFSFKGQPTAFAPVNLDERPGNRELVVRFADGSSIAKQVAIGERKRIEAPLGIPAKLGGNTAASQKALVETLAEENRSLLGLGTENTALWSDNFIYPVENPIVTDIYGYTRRTGSYSIAHKGTDFRAEEGTKILAMNRGVARLVREYRNYGKTIVLDHGLGIMTFYMHLSRIDVKEGDMVERGQLIGLSGMTGYAEVPHLHLTVRMSDVSIDPIVFLNLFGE